MNVSDMERRVIELAAAEAGVESAEVRPEHHFVNELEFDSLAMVEFAMKIEDEFHINVPDDEMSKLQTVGDVIRYVTEHTQLNSTS